MDWLIHLLVHALFYNLGSSEYNDLVSLMNHIFIFFLSTGRYLEHMPNLWRQTFEKIASSC